MEAAKRIRQAVARVSLLRQDSAANPGLRAALGQVKRVQSRRFAGTYADLLAEGQYAAASKFFLEELYSDKDYEERDMQFARIAGAIERLFPAEVAETAVALANLHALTEELDQAMATAWLSREGTPAPRRYVEAWRQVGRRRDREGQLSVVTGIGTEMARLTRAPGLRMLLKMMRTPAAAAGLASLQGFLETGFDTFSAMARRGGAEEFMRIVEARETALIRALFDTDLAAGEAHMAQLLGQAAA